MSNKNDEFHTVLFLTTYADDGTPKPEPNNKFIDYKGIKLGDASGIKDLGDMKWSVTGKINNDFTVVRQGQGVKWTFKSDVPALQPEFDEMAKRVLNRDASTSDKMGALDNKTGPIVPK